jgi:hypothetical protein
MKFTVKAAVLFALLGAMLMHAQTYTVPYFEHVIIVIQENRTPDNLFGAATLTPYPSTLPPLLTSRYDLAISPDAPNAQPWCLGSCFDPGHANLDWQRQDGLFTGGIYNACANSGGIGASCPQTGGTGSFSCNAVAMSPPSCPQETYISPTYDIGQAEFGTNPPVYPYFDIAAKYGFANYFFQTNQGPSQPAHDFLFGGTSAPSGSMQDSWYGTYYQEFAAENPYQQGHNTTDCDYVTGIGRKQKTEFVFPDGHHDGPVDEYPCFDHLTLADRLNSATPPLTWKYYARSDHDIWNAPAGIAHICYGPGWTPSSFPYDCANYSGYSANVAVPSEKFFADFGGGGTNIVPPPGQSGQQNCHLPNVSWIIPNGSWSDHPGPSGTGISTTTELGPDWVADIVNAVGNATCTDEIGLNPWQDTVIFVVWDDWGGFYDHVGAGLGAQVSPNCFFPSGWGCGYTYGFRVPFMVVSQYTSPGYVSGACVAVGNCPNFAAPYEHDFGSILAFIENNFNLGTGSINSGDCPPGAIGCSLFADNYAPELQATGGPYLPLGDFFNLWNDAENWDSGAACTFSMISTGCPRTAFDPITLASGTCTVNGQLVPCYGIQYFQNGGDGQQYDPDNDVIDND